MSGTVNVAQSLRLAGGRVLTGHALEDADLILEEGRIAEIGGDRAGARTLDCRRWMVLPGIVDIHGDAFERQLQPRPGIDFPAVLALEDTERQLLASGITTAFHGVTLSWEPGLRGLATWRALLDALGRRKWTCDMRVHLRWEACNLDALETALADVEAGRVHLLAFNDHTHEIIAKLSDPVAGAKYAARAGVSVAVFRKLAERAAERAAEAPAGHEVLAAAARKAGLPMASHDDNSIAGRDTFRHLGAHICEFPMSEDVGQAARASGDAVVMGSPNVVRGRSHLGWTSAAELVEAGTCTVLSSDYFYPCLAQAPFVLARRGVVDLPRAWGLVSANAAQAALLPDRGRIEPGLRADLVVVANDGPTPTVMATVVEGRIAHLAAEAWDRIS
jgi:alpha-D-ribose 1-methylphosphonate 5-triphosphate diphosphatase